ncbi:ATP-binding cassette domain-containing protein [Rhodococcus globerulus]|jgi:ribose transport system ATP-binding protein|uniref:ATP-binding cassette domain-containing protein n=1 Tax=Rhodococcus globerulus TaxID=33008 RepID=UPI001F32D5D4|nr:sugar ABC transporter ATP-binding protein [Rhodococcus globerulus]MCE4267496.1 sugar ABC transporter ATP-binding protein [Rhodococcus globerulus]
MSALLEVSDVTKSFGSKSVLTKLSFSVSPGSVHALLGANGAGKSTLIKILSGVHMLDRGKVRVRSRDSDRPGVVGFIHQDLGLIDELTVRENLFLGVGALTDLPGIISASQERRASHVALAEVNLDIDPDVLLGELTLGQKTMVAVARLFASPTDVVVLDESTAALDRAESEWLLARIRQFTDGGGAALLVTHRLHEVVEYCDTTTVMRDGSVAFSGSTPDLVQLHALLVDSLPEAAAERSSVDRSGSAALSLASARTDAVGPITLDVHSGEVVALVGSLSSRLYDVGHMIAGQFPLRSGTVDVRTKIDGAAGTVALLPEDRLRQAALTDMSVAENVTVSSLRHLSRYGLSRVGFERREAVRIVGEMGVAPTESYDMQIGALSGGNQQKVFLGRVILSAPDVYVLCEPTRGVDVSARAAIHAIVAGIRESGAAVIVVTIDVDDAFAMADRVGLVVDGRIDEWHDRENLTIEYILERVS